LKLKNDPKTLIYRHEPYPGKLAGKDIRTQIFTDKHRYYYLGFGQKGAFCKDLVSEKGNFYTIKDIRSIHWNID